MKEELLTYLSNKRNLTVKVAEAENCLKNKKNERKTYFIFLILFGFFILTAGGTVSYILLFLEIPIILLIINLSVQVNSLKKDLIAKQSSQDYLKGMEDFPSKFYDYATLGHLMRLIQVNRVKTIQEAFNLLESRAYQGRLEEISKQNLAYTKKINNKSKTNNFLNLLTVWSIWKKL
ncbi:hypothetical protein C1940_17245 (plasmid) [Lactiplantibacillus plantarum subsp. plantarum]|uniref:hypothetical protein n=1 Tax=Lactiplantibacillus plantarum TaxID=1590 RepID=UPI000CD34F42|nr:hypothetical protein [Lactiplantibacillus plantarum]AUV74197.1 hypothetical protein C1940_17245 [Lactiplantibacillus plantarum subsp. plantarum]